MMNFLWPNRGMNGGENKKLEFYEGRCNSVINSCNFSFFGLMLKVFPAVPLFISPKFAEYCPFALLKREKLAFYKADIHIVVL